MSEKLLPRYSQLEVVPLHHQQGEPNKGTGRARKKAKKDSKRESPREIE